MVGPVAEGSPVDGVLGVDSVVSVALASGPPGRAGSSSLELTIRTATPAPARTATAAAAASSALPEGRRGAIGREASHSRPLGRRYRLRRGCSDPPRPP